MLETKRVPAIRVPGGCLARLRILSSMKCWRAEPRFSGGVFSRSAYCRWDMETFMKTAFAALTFLLATAAAACNTVEGAGKDVKAAGSAIEEAADDAK